MNSSPAYFHAAVEMRYDGDTGVATFEVGETQVKTAMPFADAHALHEMLQKRYVEGFRAGFEHAARTLRNMGKML